MTGDQAGDDVVKDDTNTEDAMTTETAETTVDWGTPMEPRDVTDADIAFWYRRTNGPAYKVEMKGEHIGARNIEVVRALVVGWGPTWNVPYIVPGGDGTTYWFTMFTDTFPPISAVVQAPT